MRDTNLTSYELHLNLTARLKKWNGLDRVSMEDFVAVAERMLRELLIDGYSSLIDAASTVWDAFCRKYGLEDMEFFPRAYSVDIESENRMLWPMEAYGWVELAALIAYGKNPEAYIRDMKQYFGRNMEPTRARKHAMDSNLERLDVWVRSERLRIAGGGAGTPAGRMQEMYAQERSRAEGIRREAEQKAQEILHDAQAQAEVIARKIVNEAETEAGNMRREADGVPAQAKGLMDRARFEAARITDHARKAGRERLDTQQRAAALGEQKNITETLLETEKTLAGVHETLRRVEKQLTESFIQRVSIQLMELYDLAMDSYESISAREELPAGEILLDLAEIVAQDLAEYGIEPIITDPGTPFGGAIHEAVGNDQFDPRSAIVQKSLRFGFRRDSVILRKEKVEITDPEAARRREGEPAFLREDTEASQCPEKAEGGETAHHGETAEGNETAHHAETAEGNETAHHAETAEGNKTAHHGETAEGTETAQDMETAEGAEPSGNTSESGSGQESSEPAEAADAEESGQSAGYTETAVSGQSTGYTEAAGSGQTTGYGDTQESTESGKNPDHEGEM